MNIDWANFFAVAGRVVDSLSWAANPWIPIALGGILAFFGIMMFVTAGWRANRRFDRLMTGFNTVTAKLNEAEKMGHFGSFTYDFAKGFNFWSEEMFTLFGLVAKQNAPTIAKMIVLTYDQDRKDISALWERAQNAPGPFEMRFRVSPPDLPMRYLHIQGQTTIGPDKKPTLIQGIAHDITKEVEINRAKTEFVSLASHQLKTPLTAVSWLAEGLLSGDKGQFTDPQKKYLHGILDTNRQMITTVNDLLSVSRIELNVLDVRPVDVIISDFVKEMVNELRHSAEDKKLTVVEKYGDTLPGMLADKNLLRMIVQNLLTNAIKYTLHGGTVTVEISNAGVGDKIFMRVSDTGIGIPKAAQSHMFEKLYRAENAQKTVVDGTGLGLYTIKTIIEKVGGGISFDSKEGKGTNFYVTLPTAWKKTD